MRIRIDCDPIHHTRSRRHAYFRHPAFQGRSGGPGTGDEPVFVAHNNLGVALEDQDQPEGAAEAYAAQAEKLLPILANGQKWPSKEQWRWIASKPDPLLWNSATNGGGTQPQASVVTVALPAAWASRKTVG